MAYTEFYVQPTGSNLNAGSTNTDAPTHEYASGDWVQSTRVFTVASGNPDTDGVQVGDFASVYPNGSTTAVYISYVTAVSSTTITLSPSWLSGTAPTNGTGDRTLRIGGAWAGPSGAVAFPFNFISPSMRGGATSAPYPRVNIKGGTAYAITATMTRSLSSVTFEGYTTTVGDGGRAEIQGPGSGTSFVLLTSTGSGNTYRNLHFNQNGSIGSQNGVNTAGGSSQVFQNCAFSNMRGAGGQFITLHTLIGCEFYGNNIGNAANIGGATGVGALYVRCVFRNQAGSTSGCGYQSSTLGGITSFIGCLFYGNPSAGIIQGNNAAVFLIKDCEFYNNGGDGVSLNAGAATTQTATIINSNFVENGGWGINFGGQVSRFGLIANCGFGSGTAANSSGQINAGDAEIPILGVVTYPPNQTPWADPDNGDFTITLPQAKGAGYGQFPGGLFEGHPDIGAAQSECTGGGGGGGGVRRLITTMTSRRRP